MAYRGVTIGTPFGSATSFSETVDSPPEIFGDNLQVWVETKGGESNVSKDGNDRVDTWFARSASHGPDLVQSTANNKPLWETGWFKNNRAGVVFDPAYIGGTSTNVHMNHTSFDIETGSTCNDAVWAWVDADTGNLGHHNLIRNGAASDWITTFAGTPSPRMIMEINGNGPHTISDGISQSAGQWANPNIFIVVMYKSTNGGSTWWRAYHAGPITSYALTDITVDPFIFVALISPWVQNLIGNVFSDNHSSAFGAISIAQYPHPGPGSNPNPGYLANLLGDSLEDFNEPHSPLFKVYRYLRNNYVPRNLL